MFRHNSHLLRASASVHQQHYVWTKTHKATYETKALSFDFEQQKHKNMRMELATIFSGQQLKANPKQLRFNIAPGAKKARPQAAAHLRNQTEPNTRTQPKLSGRFREWPHRPCPVHTIRWTHEAPMSSHDPVWWSTSKWSPSKWNR